MLNNDHEKAPSKHYVFAVIPIFIWIGFVCSISFFEAWLKFRAPHASVAACLSIGQLIFASLNKIEWVLAAFTAAILLLHKPRLRPLKAILFYIPIACLFLQTIYVLPALSDRAESIIQGSAVSSSFVHFYYLFLEVVKTLSLFVLGITLLANSTRFVIEQH